MIDSIKIKITHFNMPVDNPYFAEKIAHIDYDIKHGKRFRKYISTNDTLRRQLQAQGNYVPKFWVEQSSFNRLSYLVLEFSAPKMLGGENFSAIFEDSLEQLVGKIRIFLLSIKVSVSKSDILDAIVTMVAFCKNIDVSQFGTAQNVMRTILPFNYRFRSKFEPKFNPQGELTHIEYFNPTSHFVVYDKKLELKINGQTQQEEDLLRSFEKLGETIRFELTLHNKTAIRQFMRRFYPDRQSYSLVDIYRNKISEELLDNEIGEIYKHPLHSVSSAMAGFNDTNKINEKIKKIIEAKFVDAKLKAQIYLMISILKDQGWAGVRSYLKSNCKPRTAANRIKELKEIEKVGIRMDTSSEKIIDYILWQFDQTRPRVPATLF